MISARVHSDAMPMRIAVTKAVMTGMTGGISSLKSTSGRGCRAATAVGTDKWGMMAYPARQDMVAAPTEEM